eukprot:g36878.t1
MELELGSRVAEEACVLRRCYTCLYSSPLTSIKGPNNHYKPGRDSPVRFLTWSTASIAPDVVSFIPERPNADSVTDSQSICT